MSISGDSVESEALKKLSLDFAALKNHHLYTIINNEEAWLDWRFNVIINRFDDGGKTTIAS